MRSKSIMKIAGLLLIISSQVCYSLETSCPHGGPTGDNQFINGGFQNGWTGWKLSGQGQIHPGSTYSPEWPAANGKVIELDVSVNENFTQTFNLQKGIVQVKFQYAARKNSPKGLNSNGMVVYWNGKLIKSVNPAIDFNLHTFEAFLPSIKGVNTFIVGGAGQVDGLGMGVDNFQLYNTINWNYEQLSDGSCNCLDGYFASALNLECEPKPLCPHGSIGQDMFGNGDFSNDWNQWVLPSKKGAVLEGKQHNLNWPEGNGKVAILNFDDNHQVAHTFNLQEKAYNLKFQYARQKEHPQAKQGMRVYWNSILIAKLIPTDDEIHTFQVSLKAQAGSNMLTLGADCQLVTFGMAVDNIRLYETVGWNYKQLSDGECQCLEGFTAPEPNSECKKIFRLTQPNNKVKICRKVINLASE